ncbi:MAG TPA: hypothetical protein VER98_06290 [Terriglobia bacterium]|nr:hypothetical protein [Terriglobia bacterium]
MRGVPATVLGVLFVGLWLPTGEAQFGPEEPLLMPGGLSTADTLRRKEWLLAPPPWGWVAYGATSQLTIAWDYPAALFGFPAGFIRYQLPGRSDKTHFAAEFYAISFGKSHTDERSNGYRLEHRGMQSWVRLENSSQLSANWRLHLYAGGNYAEYQRYFPHKEVQFPEAVYEQYWSPDAGAALEWSPRPKVKVHLNYAYGNTFSFVDQVALKRMVVGQLHFAPFGPQRSAFLRNMRLDLSAIYVNVPIARYRRSLPIPIYPTMYWQWGGSRN